MRPGLLKYGKAFAQGLILSLPVCIAFVDNIACIATVHGASMKRLKQKLKIPKGRPSLIGTPNNMEGCVKVMTSQPSFNPDYKSRDVVVLSKLAVRNFNGIHQGDVVSIVDPHDPDIVLMKRIVALQGDTVKTLGYKNKYVKIPRGHCWVEGDNSHHSMDSNTFGPVPIGLVQAKATHVIWPVRRWCRVESKLLENRAPLNHKDLHTSDELEDKDEICTPADEEELEQHLSNWKASDLDSISDCTLTT